MSILRVVPPLAFLLVSTATLVVAPPAAAQTPVTTCGQAVAGAGILTADLDCSTFGGPSAAILSPSSSLDLAGFTFHGPLAGEAVRCEGDCTILTSVPGGTLLLSNAASNIHAINADGGSFDVEVDSIRIENFDVAVRAHRSALRGVTITGTTNYVVAGAPYVNNSPKRIVVEDSLIANNARFFIAGLLTRGALRIRDSRFENNTLANDRLFNASVFRAKIRDTQFVGNTSLGRLGTVKLTNTDIIDSEERGLGASLKLRARGGTISGNGVATGIEGFDYALGGGFLKVRDLQMSGNLTALSGDTVRARDVTITDSVVDGVRGRLVFLSLCSISNSGRYGVRARAEEISFDTERAGKAVIKLSAITGSGLVGLMVDGRPRLSPKEPPNCVVAAKAIVTDSDLSANGTDPDCGIGSACADLAACDPGLVVSAATCGVSYQVESGLPGSSLGVCSLD